MEDLLKQSELFANLLCGLIESAEHIPVFSNYEEEFLVTVFPVNSKLEDVQFLLKQTNNSTLTLPDSTINKPFAIVSKYPEKLSLNNLSLGDLTYDSISSSPEVEKKRTAREESPLKVDSLPEKQFSLCERPFFQCDNQEIVSRFTSSLLPDVKYQPVSVRESRHFLTLYSLAVRRGEKRLLPYLCIISAKDKSAENDVGDTVNTEVSMLACNAEGSGRLRMTAVKCLSSRKPAQFFVERDSTSLHCEARYQGGPGISGEDGGTEIVVEFEWTSPKSLLALPSHSARANLKVRTVFGSSLSLGLQIFDELVHLSKCLSGTVSNEATAGGEESSFSVSQCVQNYRELITSTMLSESDMKRKTHSSDPVPAFTPRVCTDFLEHLWTIVCGFSKPTIRQALREVFALIFSGELQPYLSRSNTTSLACIIRKILLGQERMHTAELEVKEALEDTNLLDHLAEVGIFKISQDLKHLFQTYKLLPKVNIQSMIELMSSKAECFSILVQYYKILELLLSVDFYFHLPEVHLEPLVSALIKYYSDKATLSKHEQSPVFVLAINAHSSAMEAACSHCSKLQLASWKVTNIGKNSKLFIMSSLPLLYGENFNINLENTDAEELGHIYEVESQVIS